MHRKDLLKMDWNPPDSLDKQENFKRIKNNQNLPFFSINYLEVWCFCNVFTEPRYRCFPPCSANGLAWWGVLEGENKYSTTSVMYQTWAGCKHKRGVDKEKEFLMLWLAIPFEVHHVQSKEAALLCVTLLMCHAFIWLLMCLWGRYSRWDILLQVHTLKSRADFTDIN